MLKIENLSVCYGNLKAIDKINLDVNYVIMNFSMMR